ncbi:hypothetical protein ACHAW5_007622 [Stephanodiscus triporus]|uniref:Uncharacterized protein n=1 Tax=Stephanodiscus triporus TaxID=2934178 RepID=A0ABD3N0W6_9STRA
MDLDPETAARQLDKGKDDGPLKDDLTHSKYFTMLKCRRQLDKGKDDGPPLKDDPTYSKYFTMLKMVSRICPYDVAISPVHPGCTLLNTSASSSDNYRGC